MRSLLYKQLVKKKLKKPHCAFKLKIQNGSFTYTDCTANLKIPIATEMFRLKKPPTFCAIILLLFPCLVLSLLLRNT